jgi:Holliday junction resolvase RusA-like endonuclease
MKLSFSVPMHPLGKARPRVCRGHAFMPKAYMDWKKEFAVHAKAALSPIRRMLGNVEVYVTFTTPTGNCRSDLDNCFGSVADALQDAGVIDNDRQIKSGSFAISGRKGKDRIDITIEELHAGK